uniref:Uncharacterized protein n=1 Tax=Ficedula albicollis TaxID=59894 RepID=A0A803V8P5_FICAL
PGEEKCFLTTDRHCRILLGDILSHSPYINGLKHLEKCPGVAVEPCTWVGLEQVGLGEVLQEGFFGIQTEAQRGKVPACGRRGNRMSFKVPSNPNQPGIL